MALESSIVRAKAEIRRRPIVDQLIRRAGPVCEMPALGNLVIPDSLNVDGDRLKLVARDSRGWNAGKEGHLLLLLRLEPQDTLENANPGRRGPLHGASHFADDYCLVPTQYCQLSFMSHIGNIGGHEVGYGRDAGLAGS